ncbi:MAG: pilus assembly PilX family protein [Burkholderiaceae bacterium]
MNTSNMEHRQQAAGRRTCEGRERGATLIVTLIILIAVSLIGISTAHIALMGEKSSRNDRDRRIAFQAAEAALLDAELDIAGSPDDVRTRSGLFAAAKGEGFTEGCGAGAQNNYLGLCGHGKDLHAAWLTVDFLDDSPKTMKTVPYGFFTGQPFDFGNGMAPERLPRYIIERIPFGQAGESAAIGDRSYVYRITAMGFGSRDSTRVMLQTFYRKE